MFDINTAVKEWRKVRQQRLDLEKQAKELKDSTEDALRASILMYLESQQLTGAKVDSGTISIRTTTRVEVADAELMCRYMFQKMAEAHSAGRPLSDALVFQKTAHKGIITEIVREAYGLDKNDDLTDEQFNAVASQIGTRVVSKEDISFTSKR